MPLRRKAAVPEPVVLAHGKRFHREVQASYIAGLLGVTLDNATEQIILRPNGTRQRADILLLVSWEPERQRFVVEIKSTKWDARSPKNRRQLFRRHLRQVHGYLDVLLEELGTDIDAVVAALLYPSRPAEPIAAELEELALSQGIMVVTTTR
ncbi:hypothetical protein [Amycolatopsis sp. NPDC003861]